MLEENNGSEDQTFQEEDNFEEEQTSEKNEDLLKDIPDEDEALEETPEEE